MLKKLLFIMAGCLLLTAAAVSVRAEEESSLCCDTSADCKDANFPQCENVGADCSPIVPGDQSYCMKSTEAR